MPSYSKFTHALVARVPQSYPSLKTIDGACIDYDRAREQQLNLVQCLRGLNVDVLELPPDETSPTSVFVADCALILQGVALICNPLTASKTDIDTVRAVLKKEVGVVIAELDTPTAQLNASDVLFTGREFFIGLGKETNTEGALNVAKLWPEYSCIPIKMEGSKHLRDRITVGGNDILCVSSGEASQLLLKRIEREANHRYNTLTVPEEDATNCLFVNGNLIRIDKTEGPESEKVFKEKVDYPQVEVCVSEFQKTGRGLSSVCLLLKKSKTFRTV